MICIIVSIIILFSLFPIVNASNWSENWSFNYEDDYDVGGEFSSYSTLTFGGKINSEEPPPPPSFSPYIILNFSGKGDILSLPSITINFAGNLSDSGGPYYRPPGESIQLTGAWSDGYYANSSKQQENWIYINCTITNATTVYLDWLNETTWTNGTYSFSNTGGDWWVYNTSGNIETSEGYNYSFNINATGDGGSSIVWWNKTTIGGSITRRYVQLNCTETSTEYIPLYVLGDNQGWDVGSDISKADRYKRDQGTDGSAPDTSFLVNTIPTDSVINTYCTNYIVHWFDNDSCPEAFTLEKIYFHVWVSSDTQQIDELGYEMERNRIFSGTDESFVANFTNNRSEITYDGGTDNDNYYLITKIFDTSSVTITDNNIYEFNLKIDSAGNHPALISNRSFTSFILLNPPNNETLNGTNSDGDGINDYDELYVTYTNPFLDDTDNDGLNDNIEYNSGSDPNDYLEAYDTDISVQPGSWNAGTPFCDTNVMENFTFYQNGSGTINVTIGFNDTNYTYVNWATYQSNGHDQYTANFTNNNWATESNIEPGYPVPWSNMLNASVGGNTNFTFGVRLWTPKSVSTDLREDFEIVIKGNDS